MPSSSLKPIDKTVKRIQQRTGISDEEADIVRHMLNSVVESRDKRIRHLQKKARPKEFDMTETKIRGALRDCIKAHGPITKELVPSASKRILGVSYRLVREPSAA